MKGKNTLSISILRQNTEEEHYTHIMKHIYINTNT